MNAWEATVHSTKRPNRRDWLVGLAAGASLGLVILGIGGRYGMRLIAVAAGQPPAFTIEGSIAVSLLGALAGAVAAAVFLLARVLFPTKRWMRGALFWVNYGAIVLRGLSPVTTLNAGIFLPLFLLHGILLQTFWYRIHLPRARARA